MPTITSNFSRLFFKKIVSAGNGRARSESNPAVGTVIGKAVEDHNSTDNGVIDIMVNMM